MYHFFMRKPTVGKPQPPRVKSVNVPSVNRPNIKPPATLKRNKPTYNKPWK